MYFRKISIHGFKSFADPITIEFDRGITCVVGPNGSGKSNIFDALRWVLGEQSPKTLRGGKMDEVIFAGTSRRKSRGMAEVSLVIDNSDSCLPLEFSEVEITRRMYRSGESEYYINRSRCRLRDIRELVMDTGIGVDGYSFIGQGKIAEIVSGREESRRKIFEEAAGIVRYRNKKAETEKKLEDTGRNLDRVRDIVAGLEERIKPLKKEAERAALYLQLSRAYMEAEIEYILKTVADTETACTALKQKMTEAGRQMGDIRGKAEKAAAEAARLSALRTELEQEDLSERDKRMESAVRLSQLKNDISNSEEKILFLREQIGNLKHESGILESRLREEESKFRICGEKSEELSRELSGIRDRIDEKKESFIADSGDLKKSETEAAEGRNRIYEIGMEISSVTAEAAGLKKLRESLSERCRRLKEETEAGPYPENLTEKEENTEIFETEKMLREAEESVERLRRERKNLSDSLSRLTEELRKAVVSISRQEAEKNALIHMENTYEGYSGAVRCIMSEKGLDGIFGTVGELIEVPEGFETAVETALGARMQNVVCRDDASADRAVRLLKQKKAGRLTFLPLKSLRVSGRRPESGIKCEDGFLAEAVSCVRTEDAYKKAVEYLLSGVIIVDSLKSASRIAARYRGCRCVTLEGELVSTGGAITGGSYRKSGGGILDRKKRIAEIGKKLHAEKLQKEKMERDASRLRIRISEAETLLSRVEKEAGELRIRRKRQQEESVFRGREREKNLIRLRRMQQEKENLVRETEETDQRILSLESEESRLKEEMKHLSVRVERLLEENEKRRRDLEVSGNDITGLKLKAESLKGALSAEKSAGERAEKEKVRLESEIGEKEKKIDSSRDEIRRRQEEKKRLEILLITMSSAEEAGKKKIEEIRAKKEEVIRLAAEQNARKENSERMLFELGASARDTEARLRVKEEEIRRLKNRLWDEFEMTYPEASAELNPSFLSAEEAARHSGKLKRRLKELGTVNVGAAAEYEELIEKYEFLTGQKDDLTEAEEALRKIIRDTDRKIRSDFQETFRQIQIHFRDVFSELFGGGTAKLSMRGEDPLNAEIDITAQPPGKKLQNMNLLSGGEKTMTAVALMFAVLKAKPAPFCILDEVEAALDEANIERFSAYLENFRGVQFVLVTHQKVTMEHADALYGVTMAEKGISQVLSLKLRDAGR